MLILVWLFTASVQTSDHLDVQDRVFYIKNAAGEVEKSVDSFEFIEDRVKKVDPGTQTEVFEEYLMIENDALLRQFAKSPSLIPIDWIKARELSNAEKAIDVAFMLFTSLLIMMIHDVFELGPEFRMTRSQGIVFFVIPYEAYDLYYRCNGREALIATSQAPTEKTLKDLKSLDEVEALCSEYYSPA